MAHERGYRGSPDHFRHLVAEHRPRRPAEAYLRLRAACRVNRHKWTGRTSTTCRSVTRAIR